MDSFIRFRRLVQRVWHHLAYGQLGVDERSCSFLPFLLQLHDDGRDIEQQNNGSNFYMFCAKKEQQMGVRQVSMTKRKAKSVCERTSQLGEMPVEANFRTQLSEIGSELHPEMPIMHWNYAACEASGPLQRQIMHRATSLFFFL